MDVAVDEDVGVDVQLCHAQVMHVTQPMLTTGQVQSMHVDVDEAVDEGVGVDGDVDVDALLTSALQLTHVQISRLPTADTQVLQLNWLILSLHLPTRVLVCKLLIR